MSLQTLLFSFFSLLFFIPSSHATLEDFVCPDNTICPEELMPAVESWVRVFTEFDESEKVFLDENKPNVFFSHKSFHGKCSDKSVGIYMNHLRALLKKIGTRRSDLTDEEQRVVDFSNVDDDYDFSQASLRCQTGRRGITQLGISRYLYYKDIVVPMLQDANYPEFLQYQVLNESEYNPQADSGIARGMWQFRKETARMNSLVVNDWIDERENYIKATHAAMEYMSKLDRDLDELTCERYDLQVEEKWPFVVNMYHSGPGNVLPAINCMGPDLGKIATEHEGGSYGYNSRSYVPQVYAKSYVTPHREKFFGFILPYKPSVTIQTRLKKAISARALAAQFRMTPKELKTYNPGFSDLVWASKRLFQPDMMIEVPYTEENYTYISGLNNPVNSLTAAQPMEFVSVKNRDNSTIEPIKTIPTSFYNTYSDVELKQAQPIKINIQLESTKNKKRTIDSLLNINN